jgi:hypothetical protein
VSTYTVHEPPQSDADRIDRGVELEFVKDGFSLPTAVCPPIGFLANGIWLMAIAYIAGAALLGYLLSALKFDPAVIGFIFLMINIYLGFEVSTLKRWMLDQKGWQMLGVVNGKSIAECERRFFESWLPEQPVLTSDDAVRSSAVSARASAFWPFGFGG